MARERKGPVTNNGLGFGKARRQVNRTARDLERVRENSYGGLDTAIGRLYKRLQSSQSGMRRDMTKGNARSLDRILEATRRGRAANRRTTHTSARTIDRYSNSMNAGEMNRRTQEVDVDVRRADKNAQAGAQFGKTTDRTAQGMADIIQAGAQEQEANANQLAAEALTERTQADANLIAQQRYDIAMAEMQARIQARQAEQEAKNARKMALFTQRLATGELDESNAKLAGSAVSNLAQAATLIFEDMKTGMLTADIEARALSGLEPGSREFLAIRQLVNTLTTDTIEGAPDNAAQEILDIITTVPGWDKMSGKKKNATKAWIRAEIQGYSKEAQAASVKTSPNDSPAVGSSYEEYRRAQIRKYEDDIGAAVPDARSTTLDWFRENAEAALQKALPGTSADTIKDVVDEVTDGGVRWDQFFQSIGRKLPEKAQKAIRNVFEKLPEGNDDYGRGVFEWEPDWWNSEGLKGNLLD